MASRLQDVILRGTAASRPLATAVAPGTLYYSTDTATTAQSDGTTWLTYTDSASSGPPALHAPTHSSGGTDPVTVTNLAGYPGGGTTFLRDDHTFAVPPTGTGTVTHTAGALALGQLIVGNASADVKVVAATDGQIPIGKTSDGSVTLTTLTAGTNITITNAAGAVTIAAAGAAAPARQITVILDGGGSVLTTGVKTDLYVTFACTITAATLIADVSGSIVLDVLKSASFATTPTTSIVASAPPTLSGAATGQDVTLTGWTTSVAAGSRFRFSVTSVSTITRVIVVLTLA